MSVQDFYLIIKNFSCLGDGRRREARPGMIRKKADTERYRDKKKK
jgi:hypothetical protein